MSDVTVKLKISGIRTVLKSPEVTAEVARRVKRGAAAAGDRGAAGPGNLSDVPKRADAAVRRRKMGRPRPVARRVALLLAIAKE